jgi:O-antigen/teichoic acid export membrane protein
MGGDIRRLIDRFLRGIPEGFFGNIAWQYCATFWSLCAGFLVSLLLGRWLGAGEFGIMTLCLGATSVIFQLVGLRLHEAVIRYVAEFLAAEDVKRLAAAVKLSLLVDLVTGVVAFAGTLILSDIITRVILRDPRGGELMFLAASGILFSNFSTATSLGVLRVLDRFRTSAVITVIGATLKLVVTFAVLRMNYGIREIMAANVVVNFAVGASMLTCALYHLRDRIGFLSVSSPVSLLKERLREMGRFVLNSYVASVSSIPTKDLDVNVLGLFTSAEGVGIYKMAKNFVSALWAASDPILYVIYPDLARLWARKEIPAIRAFVKRLVVSLGAGGVSFYVLTYFVVPMFIDAVLGGKFKGSGETFRYMAWFIVFWMPLIWVNPLFLAAGRSKLMMISSLTGNVIVLLLYILFIPRFGINGAAVAYAMGTPLSLAIGLLLLARSGILVLGTEKVACTVNG